MNDDEKDEMEESSRKFTQQIQILGGDQNKYKNHY